MEDTLFQENKC